MEQSKAPLQNWACQMLSAPFSLLPSFLSEAANGVQILVSNPNQKVMKIGYIFFFLAPLLKLPPPPSQPKLTLLEPSGRPNITTSPTPPNNLSVRPEQL